MSIPVYIAQRYQSQYSLLGAMARELGEAFARAGCPVRPLEDAKSGPGIAIFFNFPSKLDALGAAIDPANRLSMIQVLVDHPLAIQTAGMDALQELPHYRLVLPCVDSLHLLRLRWPKLRHAHVLHGVPPEALVPREQIEASHLRSASEGGRDIDVCVAGSIQPQNELDGVWRGLPDTLRSNLGSMVELMLARPHMTFEQALDVVMGPMGMVTGDWAIMSTLWRVVTTTVNQRRRIGIVQSLQGLNVSVFGPEAWRDVCTGTLKYVGNVDYARVSEPLKRSRVCVAWGPTQFAHSFSERALLSMAAGCATVADDRLIQSKHFRTAELAGSLDGSHLGVFASQQPGQCRAWVERLLADRSAAAQLGSQGREAVAAGHLWDHRLEALVNIANDASPLRAG
jgi:hypothetical protein